MLPLLSDEGTYEMLRRDMQVRAAAQMPDDFADGSDRLLAAFRDAFLTPPAGEA